jgi:predicted ATPase
VSAFAQSTTAVPEKHLHPALLAALRRRIAQAAGHPGIPYH